MLKIIISGCNGHMGRVVESLCANDPAVEVCAGFDVLGTVDEYLDICGRWVRYEGASIEITPDMPRHTAVLQYE